MISCLEQVYQKEGDVLDLATERDIIQKSGAWFAYNGEKKSDRAVRMLRSI